MTVGRVKITIRVDAALLANIDRYAARHGVTRDAALEHWLGPCEPMTALAQADVGSVAAGVSVSLGRVDEVERAVARAIGVPV
ncbi:MAG TPA: hypothetical protein VGK52_18140 [Polyangia bacterium]